jgi:hypothetical protein
MLLAQPRTSPPWHRFLAPAPRLRHRLETATADQKHDDHDRHWRSGRGSCRTAQLPGYVSRRPRLLPGPRPVGARRPGPLGTMGGPMPHHGTGPEPAKLVRRRKGRMDARTRDRLPMLPILIRAADQWRKQAEALLAAARHSLESKYMKKVHGDISTDSAISSTWWRPSHCAAGIARNRRRSMRRVRSWSGDVDVATSTWTRQG